MPTFIGPTQWHAAILRHCYAKATPGKHTFVYTRSALAPPTEYFTAQPQDRQDKTRQREFTDAGTTVPLSSRLQC